MKPGIFFKILLMCCGLFVFSASSKAEARQVVVYKIDIKEEIGPKVWRFVQKSFQDANESDYILIDMNTYGGMVVYADSLRSLILNSRKPVWVLINNNAASAGALIAIACDRIYMREGANIGAATVVNSAGEAMPDKYQSYMRSMIRSTAQAQGRDTVVNGRDTLVRWKRDPHIAEAMVDQSIYIPGVSDSGKVVTFTPHEAITHGYCDGIADNIEELLTQEKVGNYIVKSYVPTWTDKVIGFLINPFVQGILIMIIIGGIYFELQTPGVGFPLAAAVIACVLYFAPLYLEGVAAYWEIILFGIGILLLLLEIFVIPGFGLTGISGIVCVVSALVLAGVGEMSFKFLGDFGILLLRSLGVVTISSVLALIGSIWLGGKLLKSGRWTFALQASQRVEEGYVGVDPIVGLQIGKSGITITDLRPAGKVKIDGEVYDAVAAYGGYILQGVRVRVIRYQTGQLYVIPQKEKNEE